MKTQLLQDLDESGALPLTASAPASTARLADERVDACPPSLDEGAARAAAADDGAADRQVHDDRAPSPCADGDAGPAAAHAAHDAADEAADGAPRGGPDWLAALMRQDAEHAEFERRAARARRRLYGGAAAAGVAALLVATTLWLLEQHRVDGALVVMAEATPAPSQHTATLPSRAPDALSLPTQTPVIQVSPIAAPDPPEPASVTPGSVASGAVAPASREAPSVEAVSSQPLADEATAATPDKPADTRAASAIKVREPRPAKPAPRASAPRAPPSHSLQEATRLQCQALGYDAALCLRRACRMTRFGLVCKG